MENLNEELFKFFAYLNKHSMLTNIYASPEIIIQNYLNNSEATFETPSVNDNEAQRKSCQFYDICKNPFKDEECIEVGMQDDCFE